MCVKLVAKAAISLGRTNVHCTCRLLQLSLNIPPLKWIPIHYFFQISNKQTKNKIFVKLFCFNTKEIERNYTPVKHKLAFMKADPLLNSKVRPSHSDNDRLLNQPLWYISIKRAFRKGYSNERDLPMTRCIEMVNIEFCNWQDVFESVLCWLIELMTWNLIKCMVAKRSWATEICCIE